MHENPIFLEIVINTASVCNIEPNELMSKSRKRQIVTARQMAIHRIHGLTRCMPYATRPSLFEIGRYFGKDHTTVLHSIDTVNGLLRYENLKKLYDDVCLSTQHIKFATPTDEMTFLERVNILPPEIKAEIENYLTKIGH
jgi:hypothetical protein